MFNFGLNDHQIALKDSIRRYLDQEVTSKDVRAIVEDGNKFSAKKWQGIADLGLLGIGIDEDHGGSGLGHFDIAVVAETLGRAVFPGPYIETVAIAELIAQSGTDEQKATYLPKIAAGELVATYAVDEPNGFWIADAVQATATLVGDKYKLQGKKLWVPYANVAGLVVCAVRTAKATKGDDGITLLAIDPKQAGLKITVLDAMDDAYQLCEIDLDGVQVPATQAIGKAGQGWSAWGDARRLATLLSAAEALGGMEKTLEMIVAYTKERVQFGKPIGSYQAVKHRCADMLTDLESVRGSVYYAAWALHSKEKDVDMAISSAKAFASDAYVRTTEKALQTYGAIGFTWELDVHFYLKRARRLEMSLGDATFHRESMAASWL